MAIKESSNEIDDILFELKKILPQYLEDQGVELVGKEHNKCICFHADHNDTNASCQINIDESTDHYYYYCYGCHKTGDIINAYAELESQDVSGQDFKNSIIELANRYDIKYNKDAKEIAKLSVVNPSVTKIYNEIEQYMHDSYTVVNALTSSKFGRNYSSSIANRVSANLIMASIDETKLYEHLKNKYSEEELNEISFIYDGKRIDREIFSTDRLSFPIYNNSGSKIIAFGSRGSIEEEKRKGKEFKKYKYSYGFKKNEYPFMYHKAREAIKNTKICYIVEGQFDALLMHAFGYTNTIALSGSSLSPHIAEKFEQMKVTTIHSITDGDAAGIKALMSIIDIVKYYSINVVVHNLPPNEDPDSLLKNGEVTFLDEHEDAITYILSKYDGFNKTENTFVMRNYENKLRYIIDNIKFQASWTPYIQLLSNQYKVAEHVIKNDLNNLYEQKDTTRIKMRKISQELSKADGVSVHEYKRLLENKTKEVEKLSEEKNTQNLFNSSIDYYKRLRRKEVATVKKIFTGSSKFDNSCNILTKNLTVVGGFPSHCKSSWVRYMSHQMIKDPRNENPIVIYFAMDDSKNGSFIQYHTIYNDVPKNLIESFYETGKGSEPVMTKLDGWEDLISENLYIFGRDDDKITTMGDIETITHNFTDRNKKRKVVVIIDAIDNLDEIRTSTTQRENKEVVYQRCMSLARESGVALIALAHFVKKSTVRKGKERPSSGHLKGSSCIEHDAHTILLVYNEHRELGEESDFVWKSGTKILPIIDVNISKDKSSKAGKVFIPYRFDPDCGMKMTECSSTEITTLNARREQSGSFNSNEGF